MPDLPTIAGGPSETASNPAASEGIVVTADSSAHTKGAWAELVASTAYTSSWMIVQAHSPATANGFLVDIGVGASTAETVLLPNLSFHSPTAGGRETTHTLTLPIGVPAGTRISARCQATTGSGTIRVVVVLIAAPIAAPPTFRRVENCGANPATSVGVVVADPGGVAHTDGAWTELIAATGFNYKWLGLSVYNSSDTGYGGAVSTLIDLAVGGAGSEVAIVNDLVFSGDTITDGTQGEVCFPVAIPAGTRISARNRNKHIVADERLVTLVAYGVG